MEVEGNGSGRAHAGRVSVSREGTGVVDDIVGVEVLELFSRWSDKHIVHEEGMVGTGADNSDVDAVTLVPAGEAIDNVDSVTSVEVVDGTLAVDTPHLRIITCQPRFIHIAMPREKRGYSRPSCSEPAGQTRTADALRLATATQLGYCEGQVTFWLQPRELLAGLHAHAS